MEKIQRHEEVERPVDTGLPSVTAPPESGGEAPVDASSDVQGELLRNVQLKVKVELGRTRMPLRKALSLASGSVVEFGKRAGDPVEVLVRNVPIARGQLLVVDGRFCVRITEILSVQKDGEDE